MFEQIRRIESELAALNQQSLLRRRRVVTSPSGAVLDVDGARLLSFCSNDYLGLANHPAIVAALQDGAQRYGAGSGASHLISGHSAAHHELEIRLAATQAAHVPDARALYFSSGYMANLALLSGLAAIRNGETAIFSEALNHASIIDGARLARCTVHVTPHGDLAALEHQLAQSNASNKIVVTDSVFSMDGVIAPLADMLALCERHHAWLMVDDAHGFGVLGEHGAGVLQHLGLQSPNLLYMGTLGKAAGVGGAFVAAHASVVEWLVQKARSYIYTTAAAPALAHALLTSLDILQGADGARRRADLRARIAQFRAAAARQIHGMTLLDSPTQIQPLVVGDNGRTLDYAATLMQQGIWVPAIRPPTVPIGTARLRVSLSAAHSADQVDRLTGALAGLERQAA